MTFRCFILALNLLLTVGLASAQCPDRPSILQRMQILKASDIPLSEQKKELLIALDSIRNCKIGVDTVQVQILQRMGAVSYLVSDFTDAVHFTTRSIDLLKSLRPEYRDMALLIKMYYFLSIFYDSLQLTGRKISSMDSAIHYALAYGKIDNNVLRNMMQRAEFSYNTGDYARCIIEARSGEDLARRFGSEPEKSQYASFFFSLRVNGMIGLKDYDAAELLLQSQIESLSGSERKSSCGFLYNILADVYITKKKFRDAIEHLEKSYQCNRILGYPIGCKQSLNNIGQFYFTRLNDPRNAIRYYRKALKYHADNEWEAEMDKAENANIIGNIATAFARMHEFDSSFYYFTKAFQCINPDYDEQMLLKVSSNEFSNLSFIHYVSELVKDKGDAWVERYKVSGRTPMLDSAIQIYRLADQILNRIKESQKELTSQLSWRNNSRILYEHAIEASFMAGRTEDAFYFFERSRAVLLIDRFTLNLSSAPELQIAIASIDRRLKDMQAVAEGHSSDSNIVSAQSEEHRLRRQRDELSALISSNKKKHRTLRIKDVQTNLLGDETMLLEIFSGDSSVYIFNISKSGVSLNKRDKELYQKLTYDFISFVSSPTILNSRFSDFTATAHELHRLLFGERQSFPKRMIVSHDGLYFPLEALVVGYNQDGRADYLVQQTAISYTYSAHFLHETTPPEPAATSTFAGFAPGSYPASSAVAVLPGSDRSMRASASFFQDKTMFLGDHATRNAFLNNYHRYGIVQLYSHATESASTGDPVIYFSDSILKMSELLPLNRPVTRLIILSACETGKGRLFKGEGIFSFNRIFAELGIPSSMVNLWSVDNQSTFELTELFCKYLSQGYASDIALQKAKKDFLNLSDKEKHLPFYWAASVITGNTISISTNEKYFWNKIYLFAVTLIALFSIPALIFTYRTRSSLF